MHTADQLLLGTHEQQTSTHRHDIARQFAIGECSLGVLGLSFAIAAGTIESASTWEALIIVRDLEQPSVSFGI
jgi:hypothetical protein